MRTQWQYRRKLGVVGLLAAGLVLVCSPMFYCECRGVVVSTPEVVAENDCCTPERECGRAAALPSRPDSCNLPIAWDLLTSEKSDLKSKNSTWRPMSAPTLAFLYGEYSVKADSNHSFQAHCLEPPHWANSTPLHLRIRVLLI